VRRGGDVFGQKGAEFGSRRGGQHGDPGVAGKKSRAGVSPRAPDLPFLFFSAGTFSTAATTKLLSGLAVLRPRLVGSPRPADEGLVRL
jgi:hypothetical protein